MTEPLEADTEQTDLEDFAGLLSRLRADELVADKPTDLSAYGLDRPEVRWQVFAGEKPALDLLVGVEEKSTHAGSGRRFAKLANDSLIFLCSPQLTGRLLGEYRTRTIWPPLDASQIDRLSFGYADNPFVLEKPENEWRVAGKPQVKVQADAVREALDALAGLKAARYVIDKAVDLKLYGLEPPQLVLQIQTRSGGRSLHIGRREGESNRYYARVPEGDNTAVFVIAEGDASRFIRSLPGFVQKGTSSSSPIR